MLGRAYALVEKTVVERPRTVLAAALVSCALAAWLGAGIELRTARRELVAEGDVRQLRWNELRAEFSAPEPLIVVLEAVDTEVDSAALADAARAVAARLAASPRTTRVFFEVDLDWIATHAVHLAPSDALRAALVAAEDLLGDRTRLDLSDWATGTELIAQRLRRGLETNSVLPGNATESGEFLFEFFRLQREFYADPNSTLDAVPESLLRLVADQQAVTTTDNGVLSTDDGRAVFVLANMAGDDGDLGQQRQLLAEAQAIAADVLSTRPGIRASLTGAPALDVEETTSIRNDGIRTSVIAAVGVLVLSLGAFQRARHAALGVAALMVGVVWALGAVRLQLGYLNLITTALIPILVGMGIDYAVHPLSQFEIERRRHPREVAVRRAFERTGPAVIVSALTTAAAFFCFLLMQFRGFSELGLVTGVGVVLCLAAAILVLPALLTTWACAPRDRKHPEAALVDRVWTAAAARALLARPRLVLGSAVVVTLGAVALAPQVALNSSLLDLLPLRAESLRTLSLMNERSSLRNDFNLVVTSDLAALRDLAERAAGQPAIDRFESALDFVPDAASGEQAAELANALVRVRFGGQPAPTTAARKLALQHAETALTDAADGAFGGGQAALAADLERARVEATAAINHLETLTPAQMTRIDDAERRLAERLEALRDDVIASANTAVPSVATLPAALADRFITRSGRHVGYLYPRAGIFDGDVLRTFNEASLAVSPDAIGFPLLFEDHAGQITSGFGLAMAVGSLVVGALLWVALRRVTLAALALLPVLLSGVWLFGLMAVLSLQFNLANLIAVPIILGVGIDGGVHMVHRYRREGRAGLAGVLEHTGRALIIASLTTMIGFGSLAFASHRGMASLGALLFLGVGASLLAALVVLPCVLVLLPERDERATAPAILEP